MESEAPASLFVFNSCNRYKFYLRQYSLFIKFIYLASNFFVVNPTY